MSTTEASKGLALMCKATKESKTTSWDERSAYVAGVKPEIDLERQDEIHRVAGKHASAWPSPSEFANWVLKVTTTERLASGGDGRLSTTYRETGELLHGVVSDTALWHDSRIAAEQDDWVLEFQDEGPSMDSLQCSALRVKDQCLNGKPDLVFRNKNSGTVIIVENKFNQQFKPCPGRAYPNNRAQLWCYGQLDKWIHAPRIYLVLQWWAQWRNDPQNIIFPPSGKASADCDLGQGLTEWYTSDAMRCCWDSRDLEFNRECSGLFAVYSGSAGLPQSS